MDQMKKKMARALARAISFCLSFRRNLLFTFAFTEGKGGNGLQAPDKPANKTGFSPGPSRTLAPPPPAISLLHYSPSS